MSDLGQVTAVCVVHEVVPGPKGIPTAIDKRPLVGRIGVGALGLAGDTQCDTEHHGGVHQALYAYSDEEAGWWAGELGREIPPGLFGENLRTSGIDVTGAQIGEQWLVAPAGAEDADDGLLVEVTSPRVPCRTFAERMDEPQWVRRFTERGLCGSYLRVLRTGTVAVGDQVRVVRRPGHGVTIGQFFTDPTREMAQALLDADTAGVVALDPVLRSHAQRLLARAGA